MTENKELTKYFSEDLEMFFQVLSQSTEVSISEKIKNYLGLLHNGSLDGNQLLTTNMFSYLASYEDLWGAEENKNIFPALLVGSEAGYYAYTLLETGDVICIHSYSVADFGYDFWEAEEGKGGETEFIKRLREHYSIGNIDQYIGFCRAYSKIDPTSNFELLELILDSFEIQENKITETLEQKGYEFLTDKFTKDIAVVEKSYFAKININKKLNSSSLKMINLDGLELKEIPDGFEKQTNVEHLILSENNNLPWESVFDILKEFTNLKRLDLSSNNFYNIPDVLFELKHIKHLNLNDCPLDENNDWGKLDHLEVLDLRYCFDFREKEKIKESIRLKLPQTDIWFDDPVPSLYVSLGTVFSDGVMFENNESLNDCSALEYVKLCDYTLVPPELEKATKLKGILMIGGEIDSLPDFITALKQIEILSIKVSEKVNANELIDQLLKMPNLKRLYLGCSWTALPDHFSQLNIESLALNLKPNNWKDVNNTIGKLRQLKHLDVSMTWHMKDFEGLKRLEQLECLTIGNKFDLENLFDILKELPKLRIIECDQKYNESIQIPESLSECKHLESIKFFGNYGFKKLPSNIEKLTKVKHIDIRSCAFSRSEINRIYELLPNCDIVWKE